MCERECSFSLFHMPLAIYGGEVMPGKCGK